MSVHEFHILHICHLTDGQDWLAACGGDCRYDFVSYHYYGTNADELIQYTKDFYAHFKKPLWLTEVCLFKAGPTSFTSA